MGEPLGLADFLQLGQEWRNAILLEIIFCCRWQLEMQEATPDSLREVCLLYIKSQAELPTYPNNLFKTAEELWASTSTERRAAYLEPIKHMVAELEVAEYVRQRFPRLAELLKEDEK